MKRVSDAQRYGLFGWPVKHSVSPQMQEAGFRELGIDASYELFEVSPDDLAAAVSDKRMRGYRGWNVTVPHKNAMMDCVDVVEPTARLIGSVNTIVNRDGLLHAYSTDGYGLETSIKRSFDVDVAGNVFLFWGCGGAARATAGHFAANGADSIILVNRTIAKAENLAMVLSEINSDCAVTVLGADDVNPIRTQLEGVDVFIQSTSVGLHVDDPISVPEELLTVGLNVVDMIYRPNQLLKTAVARGCNVTDGRDMLLYQGVRSFEIWTGQKAPVDVMGAALDAGLGR